MCGGEARGEVIRGLVLAALVALPALAANPEDDLCKLYHPVAPWRQGAVLVHQSGIGRQECLTLINSKSLPASTPGLHVFTNALPLFQKLMIDTMPLVPTNQGASIIKAARCACEAGGH